MSSRDDLQIALNGGQPASLPLWELHFHCWDHLGKGKLIIGREFEALTGAERMRALEHDADLIGELAGELGFAAVTIPDGFWELAPGAPTYYWLPDEARFQLASLLYKRIGGHIMVIAGVGGVLGMPDPGNYMEFSYQLFDSPTEVDEIARRTLAAGLENAKKARDSGIEAVYTASDLADNHGPYYKPRLMDRFVLPYLRQWSEAVKGLGLYAILHTDGQIGPILEDLVTSGIQALQAIDPVAGMDIRKVKQQVAGRICICGNLDCGLLFTGPENEIYNQAHDLIRDLAPGGGYIFGASNAVQYETPINNYLAMNKAYKEHKSLNIPG